jgi:hypothetical protein
MRAISIAVILMAMSATAVLAADVKAGKADFDRACHTKDVMVRMGLGTPLLPRCSRSR